MPESTDSLSSEETPDASVAERQTLEIYKNALNFNVIAKYDPLVKNLIFQSSHCVVYRFENDDWVKLDYQGPIVLYSRRYKNEIDDEQKAKEQEPLTYDTETILRDDTYYEYGIIVYNRNKPQNFSIGIIPTKRLRAKEDAMIFEKNDELIIVKDLAGDAFGLWIFDEKDRDYICQVLNYCIDN
ncbi:unnamed protein product [Kuraishia capsulata CBS 1993]|uniref:Uncharacterized protein n=1 Tax=Kuraishia capsulata CBS 1993 TaxID=1382522 RepID=W6MPB0_9ASCO|nr:uncharacterized protein KUCA_T00004114001 [Kuraishia capsulata CBS 1993]CDK28133.1 unnamed protein product [Kuraishia capsulata CBS 1993]